MQGHPSAKGRDGVNRPLPQYGRVPPQCMSVGDVTASEHVCVSLRLPVCVPARPRSAPPRLHLPSQHAHGGDTLCPASAFTALLLSHTHVSWTHAGGTCSRDRRQSPRDVDGTRCSRTHEVGTTACPGDPARPRLHLRAVRGVTPHWDQPNLAPAGRVLTLHKDPASPALTRHPECPCSLPGSHFSSRHPVPSPFPFPLSPWLWSHPRPFVLVVLTARNAHSITSSVRPALGDEPSRQMERQCEGPVAGACLESFVEQGGGL